MAVYIIRAGEDGPVKIGYSTDPGERIKNLQAGHYERLTVIRVLDGGYDTEATLHRHYSHLGVVNEWFRFCPTMLTVDPSTLPPPPPKKEPFAVLETDHPLKRWMAANSLTPTAFARRIGKSHSTVLRWLDGTMPPSPEAIHAIYEATDGAVSACDLFGQERPSLKATA